ncbi:hypothetical protein HK103_004880 [Boothiomyces macroporosus]|uniref:Protein-serine/threonine kinase n=1 Tax=Boothiomyces macroporosus TaxID=261099 RepID=A0AAD5UG68_9FUNG|nr:hypothetical protein HK103_004880 [Boothiomyces macroporosus]
MITFKRLLHSETTVRMSQIATRPFRKIKVKEHLGPGILHVTKEPIQLNFTAYKEIDDIPQIRDLEFARQIKALYTKTCQELFEFTDEIERMRRGQATNSWPEQPSKSWPFSLFKSEKPIVLPENMAPPEEDLDKIVFGTECHDPILASKAEHLTDKLFHVLERAVARHKPIMLLAAQEENRALLDKLLTKDELQTFLTKFHMQRIAVRLLIGHCVALSKPLPLDNMIGIFCTKTPIEDIVTESVQLAEDLCMITYGCVPPIELSCTPESKNFDLLYIPRYTRTNKSLAAHFI